jgi:hypothetical protein
MSADARARTHGRTLVRLAAIAAGLCVAVLLAEIGVRISARVAGRPFDPLAAAQRIGKLRSNLVDAAPRANAIDENALRSARAKGQILHPYFGYDFEGYFDTFAPEIGYFRSQDAVATYDVLILGGSVAMNFVPDGVERLRAALRADPELAQRTIRVWGQGRAAQKAPQQALVLQFLLAAGAKPDAVISLDGFNEVAVGLQNERQGVAGTYPCASIWLGLAGAASAEPLGLERALELRRRQLAVIDAAEDYARWGLQRSALASWLGTARVERLLAHVGDADLGYALAVAESDAFSALRGPFVGSGESADDALCVTRLVRAWRENVRTLHALCAARGIDFLDALQPTALIEGSKPLDEAERSRTDAIEAWRAGVALGYPELVLACRELDLAGVPCCDATRVFAETREAVYVDSCHVDAHGYELLGERIGSALVEARARKPR